MNGASWTADPAGSLIISTHGTVNRYRFGTGTADFYVCATCGVVPAVTWESEEGKLLGVVHVQCLDSRDKLLENEVQTEYEGEALHDRLNRRSSRWTPVQLVNESRAD